MSPHASTSNQRGLGMIAAMMVLVVLSVLAAAIVRLSWTSHMSAADDLLGAKALQAAGAGTEWGLYQALKGSWTTCSSSSQTLDLRADMGFLVTVTCSSRSYNEGESPAGTANTVRLFTIEAVACNSSTACPDATMAVTAPYVERRRQVQASDK
jgi:MSHA biogenesis protein MshP